MRDCGRCGKKYQGNFCPYCGAKWTEEQAERVCPNCGESVAPDMHFCANCGYDFSKKQSGEETHERASEGVKASTANWMEVISSMLRISNAFLSVLFSLALWLFFALPVTSILGMSIGNLYQFMGGTTALGTLLPPIESLGWVFTLALTASVVSFTGLCVIVGTRKEKSAHMKHVVTNFSFLLFHVAFFVIGCVIRTRVVGYGLAVGGCATALMISSAVFATVSFALSVASYNLTKQAQEPRTPEEKAEHEEIRAVRIKKTKRIAISLTSLGIVAVTVVIIVGVSTNIFRQSKVDNIAIGASEAGVLDVLGEPYYTGKTGEYTNAEHDTVWKYYSKNYISHHEKIDRLIAAEDISSLGTLSDAVEDLVALNEKNATLRYKCIEVAFKDGKVVAVYLMEDICDGIEDSGREVYVRDDGYSHVNDARPTIVFDPNGIILLFLIGFLVLLLIKKNKNNT